MQQVRGLMDRCPTCRRKLRRRNEANALYWLLLHAIADNVKPGGLSYSADQWHLYAKSRWLGCDDIAMPNGKTMPQPKSSAELSTEEFSDFYTKVEAWAAERGVFLADREAA